MEYKIIQNVLLNRGNSFKSTEFSEKVDQQLSYLIDCNKTPLRVLQPNQIATNFFLQDMLDKLAIKGYISKKFKNEQAQTNWIHKAFNVEFHYTNQHEKDILKIDWNNLNSLADWLLFLKKSCIVYNHKNNKQLLDWVLEHVVYKGKNFSKGSTNYESLIRSIKIRKKQEGLYFSVDEKKLFQIKYIPHAVNSLNN